MGKADAMSKRIPAWWFKHVLKLEPEKNIITFYINGKVIEAHGVMLSKADVDRLWPEKPPEKLQ
jgi:hypothetical protein